MLAHGKLGRPFSLGFHTVSCHVNSRQQMLSVLALTDFILFIAAPFLQRAFP